MSATLLTSGSFGDKKKVRQKVRNNAVRRDSTAQKGASVHRVVLLALPQPYGTAQK